MISSLHLLTRYLFKSILASDFVVFLVVLIHRLIYPARSQEIRSSNICIYSACYGGYDNLRIPRRQSIKCVIKYFSETESTLNRDDFRSYVYPPQYKNSRHSAKYFKLLPHRIKELQECDITIWIDASCVIKSKYAIELILLASNATILMKKHPDRSSIIDEARYSQYMLKYSGSNLIPQAQDYINSGLSDDHLWHCAFIVRKMAPSVTTFNEIWWDEMTVSLQDQLSAPYAEYMSGLHVSPIPRYLNLFSIIDYDLSRRLHEYNLVQ